MLVLGEVPVERVHSSNAEYCRSMPNPPAGEGDAFPGRRREERLFGGAQQKE